MKINLELIYNNNKSNYALHVGDKVKIGRKSSCDWIMKDDKVSSFHCCFFFREDRLEIVDLKSKNGTFLNGIKIESADFFIGDHIKIGDSTIWLRKYNADDEAINILTFPGPNKKNMNLKLLENLTSVRIASQLFKQENVEAAQTKNPNAGTLNSSKKSEINIIKLKNEIRKKYRSRVLVANLIDIQLYAFFSLTLLYFFRLIQPSIVNHFSKIVIFTLMQVFGMLTLFIFNHRYQKYTIGEKITGLPAIYLKNGIY
jgi:pSer/pThr/pTyr-binding forkhead associated (FHA) protein